jgi:DNA-binding transcriptional LysR family regulator
MWLPSELTAFAQVVELGSFTASARSLGVPKVAVSRAVQSLEKRVGTRLLTRTTRRVALTDAGRALLPHAQRIAAEVAAARRIMVPLTDDRRTLRVLADPAYGRLLLAPLLPRFMERYPDIALEVEMAQALPDEPGEQWDVLFQNGPPRAEGLVGTPLGRPPVILCATPAYLKTHPAPQQPADLVDHAVLVPGQLITELRLHRGRTQAQIPLTPRLIVTDPAVVHAATAAGAGIGVLPEFLCRQGLAMNKLERVLPEWQVADLLELHAVSDLRRASSPAVKALLEFFVANMVPVLGRA